ncbi:hypothetical protein DUPY_49750 [Duganella phyllosphaerae]|uniref:NAD-specific glutamate dehydrogenase n=1 Tax=Duganella phyllosphaerae TaxID=762836 RepID=A0A1E7W7R6_9BURK|nr:hypothetical protein DUPY_49750 [Duganella phyllosphaerae]
MLQARRLLFGAARQVEIAVGDFGRCRGDLVGAGAYLAYHAREVAADAIEGAQHQADFIVVMDFQVHVEVALGDAVGGFLGAGQRPRHHGAHQQEQDEGEDHQRGQADQRVAVAQGGRFAGDFVGIGAAHDQPVPVLEGVELDHFLAWRLVFAGGPVVGHAAGLGLQHLADDGLAVGALGIDQVVAFALGMDQRNALFLTLGGIDDVDVAGVADLDRLDLLLEHIHVLGDVEADEQHADDVAGRILDRIVLGDELLAEQRGEANITLAVAQQRVAGVGVVELGADRAFAVLFLERRGHAHKLGAVGGKNGGDHAGFIGELVRAGEVEVERFAAMHQRWRRFAGDLDRGGRVEAELAAIELGSEQAREARRLVGHGVVEHLDRVADAAQRVGDVGLGALGQHGRSAVVDQH